MSGGVGTLILSIDLELDQGSQDHQQHQRLDHVRRRLLEILQAADLPATWAVADPALSVATESIRAANPAHEIAVLGDQAWLGPGCGRMRLARELARRFQGARRAGIPASTLALRNIEQVRDRDLLLDHGITALRRPAVDSLTIARQHSATPIRYGIWQAPAAWRVPARSAWWMPIAWSIRYQIRRTIRQQSLLHLELDAPRLVEWSDSELDSLERVLSYAAARRDAGQLAVATISQLSAESLAQRAASPSRSILRPAA